MIIPNLFSKRTFFMASAIIFICLNTASLAGKIIRMSQIRHQIPYIFFGYKFSGLSDILKDSEYIGYYTDKNMNDRQNALQYAQAQYVLTPVILDRDIAHEYILLDCSSEEAAWQKIKEIGALPLRKNQFGIILARNPDYPSKKE